MNAEKQYKRILSNTLQSKLGSGTVSFVDNRPQTIAQTKMINAIRRQNNDAQPVVLQEKTIIQRAPKVYGSLGEVETILNNKAPGEWVYVGGYAAYLHAIQNELTPIDFNDYDIAVLNNENFNALKKLIYGNEDELPVVDGHDISILSAAVLPKKIQIGTAFVADSESISKTYERNLAIKYMFTGGAEKNRDKFDSKDTKRWERIQQMNEITLAPKKMLNEFVSE